MAKDPNKLRTDGIILLSVTLLLALGTFGTFRDSAPDSLVLIVPSMLSVYVAFAIWANHRFGWILLGLPWLSATGWMVYFTVDLWTAGSEVRGHGVGSGMLALFRYVFPFLAIMCALPLIVSLRGWRLARAQRLA